MKKLVILFGIIIVLINTAILLVVLNSRDSNINFSMIISQPGMLWGNLLYYSEEEKAMANEPWANIDADMAVRIVQKLIFDDADVRQPYYVMHDEVNRVFIVLAMYAGGHHVYRVIISQDTGGILLNSTRLNAGIPRMP